MIACTLPSGRGTSYRKRLPYYNARAGAAVVGPRRRSVSRLVLFPHVPQKVWSTRSAGWGAARTRRPQAGRHRGAAEFKQLIEGFEIAAFGSRIKRCLPGDCGE